MVYWIKKTARIMCWLSFFAVFAATLDYSNPFDLYVLLSAVMRGIGAAILFWFVGFILADLVFKGIVADGRVGDVDELEGGLSHRLRKTREETSLKPVVGLSGETATVKPVSDSGSGR